MALQKDYYNSRFDITKTNCYWKIGIDDGINGGKNELMCRLICYEDKTTADTNSNEFTALNINFVPDLESADNFIAQAYNYIKTLPEFAGAVDV